MGEISNLIGIVDDDASVRRALTSLARPKSDFKGDLSPKPPKAMTSVKADSGPPDLNIYLVHLNRDN